MSDVQEFELDLNSLLIREIEDIEDILGVPIEAAFGEGAKRGKALRAVAYVVKRRDNPEFTLEDAGNLRVTLASDPTTAA